LDRKYCDIFECPLNLNGICSGWRGFSIATFCPGCMTTVLAFSERAARASKKRRRAEKP